MNNGSNRNSTRLPIHNHGKNGRGALSCHHGLVLMTLMLASFYCGLLLGQQCSDSKCQECLRDHASMQRSIEKAKASMLKAFQKDQATLKSEIIHAIMENNVDPKDLFKAIDKHESDSLQSLQENLVQGIPKPINRLFAGMARVDRDDFFARYDTGVPQDETMTGNEQVLLLYSHADALPPDHEGKGIPSLPVEEATQHCNTLKLVFTEADKRNECLAIVGQYESYHVHKFMRLPEDPAEPQDGQLVAVSPSNPLRHVSRLHLDSGLAQRIPAPPKVKEYNAQLVRYLSSLDSILDELRPVAEKVAKNNTIVVMVCNHGQSELLMNFACSSQAHGLDLSQVLVFATDEETKELSEGLGLAAFYDHTNFASMPKQAAGSYADDTFRGMMVGKVYSAHLISQLGYDFLFQDVDVMWFRNPLDFFFSSAYSGYDIILQDDGARNVRFNPFYANSGFYFARHNPRTEYFFNSLLMAGSIILQSGCDQNTFAPVLQEHSSWRGLHVKTLNRNMDEFPNGYHFQTRGSYMRSLIEGKIQPYIFHYSWTVNKLEKRNNLEQMGDWRVKKKCIGRTANEISKKKTKTNSTKPVLANACCNPRPVVQCHYRDKPSRIPCPHSPPLENANAPSWW